MIFFSFGNVPAGALMAVLCPLKLRITLGVTLSIFEAVMDTMETTHTTILVNQLRRVAKASQRPRKGQLKRRMFVAYFYLKMRNLFYLQKASTIREARRKTSFVIKFEDISDGPARRLTRMAKYLRTTSKPSLTIAKLLGLKQLFQATKRKVLCLVPFTAR